MKNWIKNLGKKLDEKTSPDKPLFTQDGIERGVLRLLLMLLVYAITRTFIIKGIAIWQFFLIDMMIYGGERLVKLRKKK